MITILKKLDIISKKFAAVSIFSVSVWATTAAAGPVATAPGSRTSAAGSTCEQLFKYQRPRTFDIPDFVVVSRSGGTEIPLSEMNASGFSNSEGRRGLPTVVRKLYSIGPINEALATEKEDPRIEKIAPFLKKMVQHGETRLAAKPVSIKVLDPLYEVMPNFKPVLDTIRQYLAISLKSNTPVLLPPIILLGDPGLGKTHFALDLAETLGLNSDTISMNNVTSSSVLSGRNPSWVGATPGKVAKLLILGRFANPFLIVDEVDKSKSINNDSPVDALYNLLETKTARSFVDEFVDQPIDASLINWILTANDVSGLPAAILDRAEIFRVPNPTREEMQTIIPNIMKGVLGKFPGLEFSNVIDDEVFSVLAKYTPRQNRRLLQDAVGKAVLDDRSEVRLKDIDVGILNRAEVKPNRMGF